jgi:DNA-binding LacI/PurR family transcriptional regulator
VAVLLRSHDYLEEAPRLVEEGRVDGFIIRNIDEPDAHRRLVGKLAGRDVPFILVGNPLGDCQSITIDNVGGDFSTPSGFNAMRSSFERGRHDAVFTEYVSPPLTTVRQPFRELSVTAMETLARLLAGAPAHSRHVILPTTLVVRASCGCRYAEHIVQGSYRCRLFLWAIGDHVARYVLCVLRRIDR